MNVKKLKWLREEQAMAMDQEMILPIYCRFERSGFWWLNQKSYCFRGRKEIIMEQRTRGDWWRRREITVMSGGGAPLIMARKEKSWRCDYRGTDTLQFSHERVAKEERYHFHIPGRFALALADVQQVLSFSPTCRFRLERETGVLTGKVQHGGFRESKTFFGRLHSSRHGAITAGNFQALQEFFPVAGEYLLFCQILAWSQRWKSQS